MAVKHFVFQSLTGGGTGALDAIHHSALIDKNIALGTYNDKFYSYKYDVDSVLAEDSPDVIAPDSGIGRWILQTPYSGGFSSGTVIVGFGQSAAPTGWTKKTDWQDQSMIVYTTGNIAQGGAVDAKAAHQHGAFTLAVAQIPSHLHSRHAAYDNGASELIDYGLKTGGKSIWDTGSTGGGGSHQHTANSAPYYCSVIAATKD